MHLNDLKQKSPKDLLTEAEALGIEDASSMRKQDLMFAILKKSLPTTMSFTAKEPSKSCRTVSAFCVRLSQTI